MGTRIQAMKLALQACFPANSSIQESLDLLVMDVDSSDLLSVAQTLHDDASLSFKQLSDLCGVDYGAYGLDEWSTDTESMLVSVEV